MPKYYLKSTNTSVEILCQYLTSQGGIKVSTSEEMVSNHKEKCAEDNMQPEYQASNRKSAHKYYWSKKDIKFPPDPPSTELCQKIVSDFYAYTAPEAFEEAGCAICGKLTPVCEMKEI